MLLRFVFLGLLFGCCGLGSLLRAETFQFERLGSWGQPNYRFLLKAGETVVAVGDGVAAAVERDPSDALSLRAVAGVPVSPRAAVRTDGAVAWVRENNTFRLIALEGDAVRERTAFHTETAGAAWDGNQSLLVLADGSRIAVHAVSADDTVVLQRHIELSQPIDDFFLAGEDVVVVSSAGLTVFPADNPSSDGILLPRSENARFRPGDYVGAAGRIVALDYDGYDLYLWVYEDGAWTQSGWSGLRASAGSLQFLYGDTRQLAFSDDLGLVRIFDMTASGSLSDRGGRRDFDRTIRDMVPLASGPWVVLEDEAVSLRTQDRGFDTISQQTTLTNDGEAGAVLCREGSALWLRGSSLHALDIREPHNPRSISSLSLGPVRQLRWVDDVAVAFGDQIHLLDVSDLAQPKRRGRLLGRFTAMDYDGDLLAVAGVDRRGDRQIVLYDVADLRRPQITATAEAEDDVLALVWAGEDLYSLTSSRLDRYEVDPETKALTRHTSMVTRHRDNRQLSYDGATFWIRREQGGVYALAGDDQGTLRPILDRAFAEAGDGTLSPVQVAPGRLLVAGRDIHVYEQNDLGDYGAAGVLKGRGVAAYDWDQSVMCVSEQETGTLQLHRVTRVNEPLFFPWVTNSRQFPGRLTLVNPHRAPTQVTLTATSLNDAWRRGLDPTPVTLTLPPWSAPSWDTELLFPSLTGYSLKITTTGWPVNAFLSCGEEEDLEAVLQPAQRRGQAGAGLVFAAHTERPAYGRALVVTPLAPGQSTVKVRLTHLPKEGLLTRPEQAYTLEANRPNLLYPKTYDTKGFRVFAEDDTPLLGQYFVFQRFGRHHSYFGWSPDGDDASRPLPVHQASWQPPEGNPAWRAVAASDDGLALAEADRVTLLRLENGAATVAHVIPDFQDVRDVAFGRDWLLVADAAAGVVVFEITTDAPPRRVALLPHPGVVQVALQEGSPTLAVVNDGATWIAYQLDEATAPALVTKDPLLPGSRMVLRDGFLAHYFEEDWLDIVDLRDPNRVRRHAFYRLASPASDQRPSLVLSGDRIFQLEQGGRLSAIMPTDENEAVAVPIQAPQAGAIAMFGNHLAVADGNRGVHLFDATYAYGLPRVAVLPEEDVVRIAASDNLLWLIGPSGEIQVYAPGEALPQVLFPAIPAADSVNVADLQQVATRSGVVQTRQADGVGEDVFEGICREIDLSPPVGVDWSHFSLTATHPTQAWLRLGGTDRRTVTGIRHSELGYRMMVPITAEITELGLFHDVADETLNVYLWLLGADGVLARETVTVRGLTATVFALTELFDETLLAEAGSVRIATRPGTKLGAVVYHRRVDDNNIPIPATPVLRPTVQ